MRNSENWDIQLGYTNEEIAVNELLKKVYFVVDSINRSQEATEEEKTLKLQEEQRQMLKDIRVYFRGKGFADPLDVLPRNDGQQWSDETLKEEVKKIVGQDLSMGVNMREVPLSQKMFDDARLFRDQFITNGIANAVKSHDKVMAVMGSSHVIREEGALREYFDEPNVDLPQAA